MSPAKKVNPNHAPKSILTDVPDHLLPEAIASLERDLADLKATMPDYRDVPARTAYADKKSALQGRLDYFKGQQSMRWRTVPSVASSAVPAPPPAAMAVPTLPKQPVPICAPGIGLPPIARKLPDARIQTMRTKAASLIEDMRQATNRVTFGRKLQQLHVLRNQFQHFLLANNLQEEDLPEAPRNPWDRRRCIA